MLGIFFNMTKYFETDLLTNNHSNCDYIYILYFIVSSASTIIYVLLLKIHKMFATSVTTPTSNHWFNPMSQ